MEKEQVTAETVEFVSRCCVCADKVRAKYERTRIGGTAMWTFRCLVRPVHEECRDLFEQLQFEKSGNTSPTVLSRTAIIS